MLGVVLGVLGFLAFLGAALPGEDSVTAGQLLVAAGVLLVVGVIVGAWFSRTVGMAFMACMNGVAIGVLIAAARTEVALAASLALNCLVMWLVQMSARKAMWIRASGGT